MPTNLPIPEGAELAQHTVRPSSSGQSSALTWRRLRVSRTAAFGEKPAANGCLRSYGSNPHPQRSRGKIAMTQFRKSQRRCTLSPKSGALFTLLAQPGRSPHSSLSTWPERSYLQEQFSAAVMPSCSPLAELGHGRWAREAESDFETAIGEATVTSTTRASCRSRLSTSLANQTYRAA